MNTGSDHQRIPLKLARRWLEWGAVGLFLLSLASTGFLDRWQLVMAVPLGFAVLCVVTFCCRVIPVACPQCGTHLEQEYGAGASWKPTTFRCPECSVTWETSTFGNRSQQM